MSDYSIRELSDSDWREYKSIRLRSLQDSPDSFGSTYEQEAKFQTKEWQSGLRVSPAVHDSVTLAAVAEETFIGLLSCVIHRSDIPNAHLYQMWVAPEHRGKGAGMALVKEVKTWACDRNISNLILSVTTTNLEAISLYRKIGFEPIGEAELLRPDSHLQSQLMAAKLDA